MRRRTAVILLLSVAGLLLAGAGLSWQLMRSLGRVAHIATADRLQSIGLTAARALGAGADEGLLADLCRDHDLEDAYVLDGQLRPRPGAAVNLLRIDPDRALKALAGQPSVGRGYRIESLALATDLEEPEAPPPPPGAPPKAGADVLAGYFPVAAGPGKKVLVLEAGAAFSAVPRRLRTIAWATAAAAAGLALLCLLAVVAALRAAARERELYGQALRGQAISQLAAMVAHEIRNPLSTIRAGAELLREQAQGPAIVDDILEEVERLNALTGEFLTLSRDPPLSPGPVDVGALCDEACERLRRRAGSGLTVVRSGEHKAPIVADADRLRQVLLNLLLNAEQAVGGSGHLEVRVERTGGGVTVLVRDDGPGVDEQRSRRLFQPFATTRDGGTGLGLVLSRRIAEQHGGSLELVPTPDGQRGACFALRLPRRPPKDHGDRRERNEAVNRAPGNNDARWGEAHPALPDEGGREGPPLIDKEQGTQDGPDPTV